MRLTDHMVVYHRVVVSGKCTVILDRMERWCRTRFCGFGVSKRCLSWFHRTCGWWHVTSGVKIRIRKLIRVGRLNEILGCGDAFFANNPFLWFQFKMDGKGVA